MDREEFFRLKKVQGKKKRDAERAMALRKAENEKHVEGGGELVNADEGMLGGAEGGRDLLGGEKDEDVIF